VAWVINGVSSAVIGASKEIAAQLGVSVRTIENHRANICVKVNPSAKKPQ